MPALVACGRKWEIGSDDLVLPGIVSILIRTLWLIGTSVGVVYYRDALFCEQSHLLLGFAFSVMGIILVTIFIELAIVFFSARGTIVQTKPRKPVVHLLHFRVLVFILEVALLVVGTVFAFKTQQESDRITCPNLDDAVLITQIIVAVDWCVLLVFVLLFIVYLDPCHCYSAKVNYSLNGNMDRNLWRLSHSVWEKRFRVVCCCSGRDDNHQVAYKEVAEIFAHLFYDTNVVLSDIAAGMILLQKEHLSREQERRYPMAEENHGLLVDFVDLEEKQHFKDAMHFLKYALGMYTWPLYMFMNLFTGCCKLCCQLKCCCRSQRPHIVEDNLCHSHLAALHKVTGLNEMDIIYCSFENDIYQVPFLVCLDHQRQSVVIAIRGTLSFADVVTDLTASTQPIELPGFPNFLVHKGMLKTATWILEKLNEEKILEEAFSKVFNFKLVCVGHSLGSGCACILSMLLQDKYPSLRCFCYSPTGALLNETAAKHTESFVTSITLGMDLVARLNVSNAHILKEDLVRVLESCKKPKCQVLFEGILETVCNCFGRPVVFEGSDPSTRDQIECETSPLNPEDSLEPLVYRDMPSHRTLPTAASNQEQDERLIPERSGDGDENGQGQNSLVPLFPPGRLIHINDCSEHRVCICGTRQLEARWVSRAKFDRVIVSPDMLRDHLPNVLQDAMNCVWKSKTEEMENATM